MLRPRQLVWILLLLSAPGAPRAQSAINVSYVEPLGHIVGAPGYRVGYRKAVAVGDLSGDGIDDMALGAGEASCPDGVTPICGRVLVVFGPLAGSRDLAVTPPEVVILGRGANERTGNSVLIADLNGDGARDLAFGSPESWRPDSSDTARGEACILFGPLAPRTLDMALEEPDLCITGYDRGDFFGSNLAAGDWTGDGIEDLIVASAYGSLVSSLTASSGTLAVLASPLSPGPIQHLSPLNPPHLLVHSSGTYSGEFGSSIDTGDLNGDGHVDIAVGSPFKGWRTLGLEPSSGYAWVLFGPRAGIIDFDVVDPDVLATGARAQEGVGHAVGIGDYSGDGVADLVVGAAGWRASVTAIPTGRVHVLNGPLITATTIDQANNSFDVTLEYAGAQGFGKDLAFDEGSGAPPLPDRLLIGAEAAGPAWCHSGSGMAVVLEWTPPGGSLIDLDVERPALVIATIRGEGPQNVEWGDPDVDGEQEALLAGLSHVCTATPESCGGVVMVERVERCHEEPPGLSDPLFVSREGDDVLIEYETTGLGVDSVAIDVYRGTIPDRRFRYDHQRFDGGCARLTSPAIDVGAAAPGAPTYYYLATRGCPNACYPGRLLGHLGDASDGPRPDPRFMFGCP